MGGMGPSLPLLGHRLAAHAGLTCFPLENKPSQTEIYPKKLPKIKELSPHTDRVGCPGWARFGKVKKTVGWAEKGPLRARSIPGCFSLDPRDRVWCRRFVVLDCGGFCWFWARQASPRQVPTPAYV